MLERVKAIIACQEAGNLELASMVANGEVKPYYINDDGSYVGDPAKNALPNSSLPLKHPLIRFR